jgi:7-carboxy-7-deazaguanine synthase
MQPIANANAEDTDQNIKELDSYKGRPDGRFPIIELFGPTIQGEGAMIGVKTMFIRTGGCDYRCTSCDSMHAVEPRAVKFNSKWYTPEDAFKAAILQIGDTGTQWVTISGGNPVLWDLQELVQLFHQQGIKVAVETQGSLWRNWLTYCDMVTVSPKGPGMGEKFDPKIFEQFMSRLALGDTPSCVKIPVFAQLDLEFVTQVDRILDEIGLRKDLRYLSQGNPYFPILNRATYQLEDPTELVELEQESQDYINLPQLLLTDMLATLEMEYLPDKRLAHWKFLPQLHVLLWRNKSKV